MSKVNLFLVSLSWVVIMLIPSVCNSDEMPAHRINELNIKNAISATFYAADPNEFTRSSFNEKSIKNSKCKIDIYGKGRIQLLDEVFKRYSLNLKTNSRYPMPVYTAIFFAFENGGSTVITFNKSYIDKNSIEGSINGEIYLFNSSILRSVIDLISIYLYENESCRFFFSP